MSKNQTQTSEEVLDGAPIETPTDNKQPTVYDDLLKNGTAILTAKTREELAELVDNIPSDCKYSVGAVGQNPVTKMFTIQVTIV